MSVYVNVLPAGKIGARHVWQKHCITESLTNPINILIFLYIKFSTWKQLNRTIFYVGISLKLMLNVSLIYQQLTNKYFIMY